MDRPLDPAAALAALGRVELHYVRDLDSIWADSPEHVPDVNRDLTVRLTAAFARGTRPDAANRPRGWALIGAAGAGKTHLLGALRRQVWQDGGWFVLLDLLDVNDFWSTTALGFVDSLTRPMHGLGRDGRASQGLMLVARLCQRFGLGALDRQVTPSGEAGWSRLARDLSAAIRREDPRGAMAHRDALLAAFALLSPDPDLQDLARAWLTGGDIEADGKTRLGLMRSALPPRKAVEGLSWLMSLGGPTLCALDQIDAIVSETHARAGSGGPSDDLTQNRAMAVIDGLAGGLMDLQTIAHRTIAVVASLAVTWTTLCSRAIASFQHRFDVFRLEYLGSADTASRLVERRLTIAYAGAGFAPPYPTWPFHPSWFARAALLSPRQLLQACGTHIDSCLAKGTVEELSASEAASPASTVSPSAHKPDLPAPTLPSYATATPIEARYAELCAKPPPPGLLNLPGEDARVVGLLVAALKALVRQTALPDMQDLIVENDTPGLHARLRRIDNAADGREQHHCFRAITHTNAIAVQTRIQEAITASGIDKSLPFRKLIILRRGAWPSGPKTALAVKAFELDGGQVLAPDAADFARFAALQTLLAETPPGLDGWLRSRKPLADSPFFRSLGLVDAATAAEPAAPPPSEPTPTSPTQVAAPPQQQPTPAPVAPPQPSPSPPPPPAPANAAAIPLGIRPGDRAPVSLPLAMLPRHVAVIAGAGSGKTVLLRRLIEEAALAGVPAIVLDSNNDLVRLGDAWPERPFGVSDADSERAAAYLRRAEVVIWTPGRAAGNPLALAPLPDFAALADDAEEREAAVGMAATALEQLIPARGIKGPKRMGVLFDALRRFARAGGGTLPDLVALLRDLPDDASKIGDAPKLAAEIADALLAALSRNPLLDSPGTPLDPAVLLGGDAARVRISVINLAGLPSDAARQDFVGRLLMALFGHIRRHPATAEQPVRGLLVMDEAQNFAPSEHGSASRAATVALVRQARKYGLGMVFATQAPKAIDHNIIANCTTQMFGLTNSPAALDAVREMLHSRGGGGEDLGRLPRGEFYLTTEGLQRPQKLHTPLCLSYHPHSPPAEAEVVARAARTRVAA